MVGSAQQPLLEILPLQLPVELASLLVVPGDEGFEELLGYLRCDLLIGEISLGQADLTKIDLGLVDRDNVFGQFRLEDFRIDLLVVVEVIAL